jgi:predicted MFS family arabinose efflux permease
MLKSIMGAALITTSALTAPAMASERVRISSDWGDVTAELVDNSAPGAAIRLLGRPPVALGMAAILFLFMGQFALFTYLRPFLERGHACRRCDPVADPAGPGCHRPHRHLCGRVVPQKEPAHHPTLVAIPLGMAAVALALLGLGHWQVATVALLAAWGLIGTPAPVGWGTWLSQTLPDDAEAGGGLMVATIQLGITLGASVGGLLFDLSGYRSTFGASAAMLSASAILAMLSWRFSAASSSRE